jgi:pimeloyl-ACP methyl ester carboxylesterase
MTDDPEVSLLGLKDGRVEVHWWPGVPGSSAFTLVFLHEGLGSAGLWKGFPDALSAELGRPPTLVWSRLGYGHSDPAVLPRETSYMHHEADVVLPELLDRLEIERAVLVGHSDGASIAILHAGNDCFSKRIAALVLIAPHVFVEEESIRGIEKAREAYLNGDLRARLSRHHDDVDGAFWGWNDIWLSSAFRSWDIRDRLPSITCPVLVVQGTNDPYGTDLQLEEIRTRVQGEVKTHLIPGVGHAPHLELPELTLEVVANWIKEHLGFPDHPGTPASGSS